MPLQGQTVQRRCRSEREGAAQLAATDRERGETKLDEGPVGELAGVQAEEGVRRGRRAVDGFDERSVALDARNLGEDDHVRRAKVLELVEVTSRQVHQGE